MCTVDRINTWAWSDCAQCKCRRKDASVRDMPVDLEQESGQQELLQKAELPVFWAAVVLVFFSFHIGSYSLLWLTVWCFFGGLLSSYLVFKSVPCLPNLLLHYQDPTRVKLSSLSNGHTRVHSACPVCSQNDCHRHPNQPAREYLQPWDGLVIPSTVDTALTEFLEKVLDKFIYSWQRNLLHDDAFVDELRISIRHAASIILRRIHKINIPLLMTSKIMQAAAAHFHLCLQAKEKLPEGSDVAQLEAAVLRELGNHTHTALRGPTSEVRYFHNLLSSVLPFLLPTQQTQSKVLKELIQELFASKVFVPAIMFVSRPEFVNKLLTIIFNKGSRIHKTIGPAPCDVPFLGAFAQRRSPTFGPLRPSLSMVVNTPTELYGFMQYLKSEDAISVLQLFLTLKGLKVVMEKGSIDKDEMTTSLSMLAHLHHTHLSPTSPSPVPLTPDPDPSLTAALSSSLSPSEQWAYLRESGVVQKLYLQIYQILEETYYPQYCQSEQFYSRYLVQHSNGFRGSRMERGHTPHMERAGEKRRGRGLSQLSTAPSMDDLTSDSRSDYSDSECGSFDFGDSIPVPAKIQIVDQETQTGVKPHTLYVILTWWEGDDGKSKTVKRRFKEFDELDTRLRHFHGDLPLPSLPSKRTLRNMDSSFVASRSRHLQTYLQSLLQLSPIRTSHILTSFLSNTTDPTLFMPDTMGERAGKMIKSVPVPGRKKEKGLLLTDLLQHLVQTTDTPPHQTSEEAVQRVAMATREWQDKTEEYRQQLEEDLSHSLTNCQKPLLQPLAIPEPLELKGVMDLIVYMALRVFKVTQFQMSVLLLIKKLGQRTLETYIHYFVARKVELLSQEKVLAELIVLIRDNLFQRVNSMSGDDVSGDSRELEWRALRLILSYPPELLVTALGDERYRGGVVTLFNCLQCHTLNKQLFYTLLDVIVLELFPELNDVHAT